MSIVKIADVIQGSLILLIFPFFFNEITDCSQLQDNKKSCDLIEQLFCPRELDKIFR